MNAYSNLPAPLRIGLPVGLVLIIALVAWMTMLRSDPAVTVLKTQDIGEYETSKRLLMGHDLGFKEGAKGNEFTLEVPAGEATDASKVLAASGIRDRTGLAPKISCPAAPGFTATKAANERSENCEDAKAVQDMLLTAGAIAANVRVSQKESESFASTEPVKNVVGQVFLPQTMKESWRAEDVAAAIAAAVGTARERVIITDDRMQILYDGSEGASAAAGGTTTSSSSSSCGDAGTATEIETKKDAVRSCYESVIGEKLTALMGSKDRYVLTVEPTIQDKSTTTNQVRNSPGPVDDASTQKGEGSSVSDISKQNNVTETTTITPAGTLTRLQISVTLDRNFVTKDKELAVKRIVSTFMSTNGRKDPAPTVTVASFTSGEAAPVKDELDQIREDAKGTDTAAAGGGATVTPKASMPKWVLAVIAVLVVGILTLVAVLWRRSAAMAEERRRLEASFQNEQRLFEDFAQQNPDTLAQELNALFGAPAAAPDRAF
jgi:hypothetical protein